MNPFGMSAGDYPEDVAEKSYDIASVFKNFDNNASSCRELPRRQASGQREFVVEVKRSRRPFALR